MKLSPITQIDAGGNFVIYYIEGHSNIYTNKPASLSGIVRVSVIQYSISNYRILIRIGIEYRYRMSLDHIGNGIGSKGRCFWILLKSLNTYDVKSTYYVLCSNAISFRSHKSQKCFIIIVFWTYANKGPFINYVDKQGKGFNRIECQR